MTGHTSNGITGSRVPHGSGSGLRADTSVRASAGRSADGPSLVACAIALLAIRVALRTVGLRRTMDAARSLAAGTCPRPESASALIDATVERVATAAAFFPGRALCLEQSLALYYHLRRRGISAELRLGVRHTPFAAHAWVEYRGEPLHEQRDFINQFVPLPRTAS
jgi:hypothetical protein